MKTILSYRDFTSDSLKESLDPYLESPRKFKIGEQVKLKDRIGKITAFNGTKYLVLIDGKNQRASEDQLEKITASPKKKKIKSKGKPLERDIKI